MIYVDKTEKAIDAFFEHFHYVPNYPKDTEKDESDEYNEVLYKSIIDEYGYTQDLKEYCKANGLSFEKVCAMAMGANNDFMSILYIDPEDTFVSHNEEPAELLLMIERKIDGIKITPGKNLHKYCGK